MEKLIQALGELRDIQGASGNWNYDPYMHGMFNGMELMMATLEGREAEFREAPKEWLADRTVDAIVVSV